MHVQAESLRRLREQRDLISDGRVHTNDTTGPRQEGTAKPIDVHELPEEPTEVPESPRPDVEASSSGTPAADGQWEGESQPHW